MAIERKRSRVALLLIQTGADVNAQAEYYVSYYASAFRGRWTAIMLAAHRGLSDIVPALLAKGPDVNTRNSLGVTNLMRAAREGDAVIVQTLVANGADVNAASHTGHSPGPAAGWTALMAAAESEKSEPSVVRALLERGAAVNARDNDGETALMKAAGNGHTKKVRVLLAAGAEVNAARRDGRTALMLAAQSGWAAG